jgi:hypothetical protein
MANAAEATISELERKLDQASADLAKVKRTASIVGGVVLGGGVLWLAWHLFSSHQQDQKTDGA